jgi:hypothetical protein
MRCLLVTGLAISLAVSANNLVMIYLAWSS